MDDTRASRGTHRSQHGARSNILIIISDQLAQNAVGAYGAPYNRTPDLDRIAQGGVRFSQCYTPCPLCMPARAAFWTSRLPHQTTVLSNGHTWAIPDDMPTLGTVFSDAGYEAVHFGKTHDAGSLRGFRHEQVRPRDVEGTKPWPVFGATRIDRDTTERSVGFLKRTHDTPFLVVADLANPHDICGWIGENAGPHEDVPVDVELPALPHNFECADLAQRPLPIQYLCCSGKRQAQASRWNETNYRHYLAAYYHYVERVDTEIGLILDALHASPHAENTLVVLLVDHGESMAAHRLVTKQVNFYEEDVRVPFMFSGPGVEGGARAVGAPVVSTLDLVPTLCEYAGLRSPGGILGKNLLPWLQGRPGRAPHPYVISEWHGGAPIILGRMLRTARYKYIMYREGNGEELYDLHEDPGETRTLINDPRYAGALAEHRQLLQEYLQATDDPFLALDVNVDKRRRSHKLGYANHKPLDSVRAA